MAYQMQVLIVVVAITAIFVEAYNIKRDVIFSNTDATLHRKSHPRNFFLNQPFVDKTIGLQTSTVIPARDRAISQRDLRNVSSKDRVINSSGFSILRHQPFKQNPFMITSFRDKPLFEDVIPKNRKIRGEQTILRNNPFEGHSLTPEEIFEGQTSIYRNQAPFKEQLFPTPFKNSFREQSSPEQALFQKQATIIDSPSVSSSIKFYRDNYVKPSDSYERYEDIPTSFDGKSIEYDNHVPKWSSISMVPSSEYHLPWNAEMPSSMPVVTDKHNSAMPSVFFGMGEDHSLDSSKMKLDPMQTSMSNCNMSVDSPPTTVPSISVSTKQSSIVGHILTSLTTKPSSPVMATSIAPSSGNINEPIYFHATKYGAVTLPTLSELNNDMRIDALSHTPKNNLKINNHDFKFLTLEAPKNIETQSSMLNYIFPEEHKSGLKSIQNSFEDYTLPVKLKHDWPLQHLSQPETSSDYSPLSLNGKTKLILPNVPVAPISWPIEIENDVSTLLPLKTIMTPDAATKNKLPLGIDLPVDFTASIPNGLTSSTLNGISGSIAGSISTDIPGGMTTDIPASMPTLNLGQSLHHVEQLRQTQEARNPWYPTEWQLQLGGFGGINYISHTGNPITKLMGPEREIAKAGLTSPKLPQPHAPAFAKIGVGYHL